MYIWEGVVSMLANTFLNRPSIKPLNQKTFSGKTPEVKRTTINGQFKRPDFKSYNHRIEGC